MIKVIQGGSSLEIKIINLRAMMANVSACYATLSRVLASTGDIVLSWLEEARQSAGEDINFHHLFAMAMKAGQYKHWFMPDDKGELQDEWLSPNIIFSQL